MLPSREISIFQDQRRWNSDNADPGSMSGDNDIKSPGVDVGTAIVSEVTTMLLTPDTFFGTCPVAQHKPGHDSGIVCVAQGESM